MRLLILLLSVVSLAGCLGDGHGIRITPDGRMRPQTPGVVQEDTAAHIAKSLEEQFGPGWSVAVALDPAPQWEAVEAEEYGWKQLTCTITCRGPGTPPAGMSAGEIETEVRDYLARRVARPTASNPAITVAFAEPASPKPVPVAAPLAPAPAPTAGPRRYTIQPGDTLALISEVFYGTADQWRRIVDANPGLAPGSLSMGQVITVP